MADVDPVVRVEGLTKDYGPVLALDSLTLDIGGGTTGLVGANGAGKSTLLKILLGLIPATGGRAEVLGHDIATEGEAIRAAVGYLPEHDCLPPDVSASDFVVHMAMMSGLPRVAARERAAEVLRHVGLAEERYRPMGGYSTGMKQKAKLAQALAHDPRLVLLDEPTNGLDPAARDEMLGLVQPDRPRLRHRGHRHLAPARRARAGQRQRRRARRRPAAAGLAHRRVPRRHRRAARRGARRRRPGPDGGRAHRRGRRHRPRAARMLTVDAADRPVDVRDLIRDTASDLGLGLVRLQVDHRRIEDVFADADADAERRTPSAERRPEAPDDRPLGRDARRRQRHPRPGLPPLHRPRGSVPEPSPAP